MTQRFRAYRGIRFWFVEDTETMMLEGGPYTSKRQAEAHARRLNAATAN